MGGQSAGVGGQIQDSLGSRSGAPLEIERGGENLCGWRCMLSLLVRGVCQTLGHMGLVVGCREQGRQQRARMGLGGWEVCTASLQPFRVADQEQRSRDSRGWCPGRRAPGPRVLRAHEPKAATWHGPSPRLKALGTLGRQVNARSPGWIQESQRFVGG